MIHAGRADMVVGVARNSTFYESKAIGALTSEVRTK